MRARKARRAPDSARSPAHCAAAGRDPRRRSVSGCHVRGSGRRRHPRAAGIAYNACYTRTCYAYNISLYGGAVGTVAGGQLRPRNAACPRHLGGVPGAGDATRRSRDAGRPRWAAGTSSPAPARQGLRESPTATLDRPCPARWAADTGGEHRSAHAPTMIDRR